ncbi:hypothetical protein CesoFtcFv8_021768 [Champsocephalus esox]|uniref:Uncharacterized protein n=1 Tax=Champsocephalus esox TaxID=159716 RepID=A0AAN8B9X7_9TELE|nr:hypothetical protein CesoFtcFv8_021768 [Champsocephalus esox]
MPPIASSPSSPFGLRASVWPGWLAPLPPGWRDPLAAFLPLTLPSSYMHMATHTNSACSPILLGTGPRIGDMWLGEMRHDAGLRSLRQIWCPSACLQITSLERLTAIALLPAPLGFWPLLPFSFAFVLSYGSSLLQSPFYFWCGFCCRILDAIVPRGKQKFCL